MTLEEIDAEIARLNALAVPLREAQQRRWCREAEAQAKRDAAWQMERQTLSVRKEAVS